MPGKGRPSASLSSANGRLFAQEVERAREQREGSGLEQRHRAELEDTRQATRHAGFGAERAPEPTQPEPRHEVDELAGASVAPVAPNLTRDSQPPQAQSCETLAADTACASATGSNPGEALAEPAPAATAPAASALQAPSAATAVLRAANLPVASAEQAPAPAPAPEGTPLAAGTARAGTARTAPASEVPSGSGAETAARAEEVLRQIQLHLTPGVKRLTLELEPLELGRIAIQLALRSGKLSAIVRGERPETLALLQGRAEELTRLLAERGIQADEVRFELGFRSSARTGRRNASALPAPSRTSPTRVDSPTFDTYA